MAKDQADPTEAIRIRAGSYAGVDKGKACTQSSFKTKTAFLYIGEQGGRYKAMFKLKKSMAEARKLASSQPDNYEVGSTGWVTARFSADKPLPKRRWEKWLSESYELSKGTSGPGKKKTTKKS